MTNQNADLRVAQFEPSLQATGTLNIKQWVKMAQKFILEDEEEKFLTEVAEATAQQAPAPQAA